MADSLGYNDMMRMQSEAVQRVKEMQRRAQNAVQKANAQRVGRAQEHPQRKGETFRHSAPPSIQQNARATALPLDYISEKPTAPEPIPAPPRAVCEEKDEQFVEKKQNGSDISALLSGNFDKLLVVVLILLLSQEEADELLLMALGYLIM